MFGGEANSVVVDDDYSLNENLQLSSLYTVEWYKMCVSDNMGFYNCIWVITWDFTTVFEW